jgi:hypothetical protein
MHLHTENSLRIQDLDQQRKRRLVIGFAGDGRAKLSDDLIDRSTRQRSVDDLGFILGQVRQFPALPDLDICGKIFAEYVTKCLPAPDTMLEDGFKF